jgi:hypothetical protein
VLGSVGHGRRSFLFINVASCLADWNVDMKKLWTTQPEELVTRHGDEAVVRGGRGYYDKPLLCTVENTGNGYIAHFPSHSSARQDYYVCLDYAQAHDLILGLSAFKKELGFV